MCGVPALGWWLLFITAVRLGLTSFGFFDVAKLRSVTYAQAQVTAVHGRTFGVWTLLSCTLCFLCAFNLGNRPLYIATFMSFIYGCVHFILECLVYHTFPASNLVSTIGFLAVTSIVWMLLQWNSHGHGPRVAAKQS
ncbi:unnamed protein product [Urochloa humidicola]